MKQTKIRVAIIKGIRTPFQRSGTGYRDMMAWEIGRYAVKGLIAASGISHEDVDHVIMGTVAADIATTNVAREIALGAGLPHHIPAHTCTAACISSNVAIINGANLIAGGGADAVIAGGVETYSDAPIKISKKYRRFLLDLTTFKKPKTLVGKIRLLKGMGLSDFIRPETPALSEYSTGLLMGENNELLAKRMGISREEQDRYAALSHDRAVRASMEGEFMNEIVPLVPPGSTAPITMDNGPRADSTFEKLSKLKPAFDKNYGTVTAGNSSFLTDGAAAILLMREDKARALGLEPVGFIRSYAFTGQELVDELLLGPAFAIPRALHSAGLRLKDIGVFEIHGAFAAQMLANIKCLESDSFGREKLGLKGKAGEIDMNKVNTLGGSLSIGHPFGATGARLVTTCCGRMKKSGAGFGIVAGCAAGSLGNAIVIENR